jgi:hypothetical protein
MTDPISSVSPRICRQSGCTFGSPNGRCANGFADPVRENCPDLIRNDASGADGGAQKNSEISDEETRTSSATSVRTRALYPASALNSELAYHVTSKAPTRVVVVCGMPRTGKTTLILSMYERFQLGPIQGFSFAGTRTPHAFEEWCHDSREISGREHAETVRSPLTLPEENRFLHLRIATNLPEATGGSGGMRPRPIRDLLITDLHGEMFERIRDDADAARRMPVLWRADHFVQLVDGKALVDAAERHRITATARQILQSCLEAGVLSKRTIVHLVGTKWDIVRASAVADDVDKFWATKVDATRALLSGRVGKFYAHKTAGRAAPRGSLESWGALDLLSSWTNEVLYEPSSDIPEPFEAKREFDRLVKSDKARTTSHS